MKRKRILVGVVVMLAILCFFVFLFLMMGRLFGRPSQLAFGEKVAVVEIRGVITQSSDIIEEIHQYLDDGGIRAIILRIDSPGGGVGPSQEIYREVMKAKERKKVVTSMGSVAASGGYYIAAASDVIVANPGTITGSIGVIMEFTSLEELLKKIGIKGIVLKAGENKDIGSPFREMTPDERRIIQEVIDNVHQQFIDAVANGRKGKMNRTDVVKVADGRIFTGEQAKEVGLVDRMGNLDDTIDIAAELAGITGKPNVVYPRKKFSVWDLLLEEMASAIAKALNEKVFELNYRLASPVD